METKRCRTCRWWEEFEGLSISWKDPRGWCHNPELPKIFWHPGVAPMHASSHDSGCIFHEEPTDLALGLAKWVRDEQAKAIETRDSFVEAHKNTYHCGRWAGIAEGLKMVEYKILEMAREVEDGDKEV